MIQQSLFFVVRRAIISATALLASSAGWSAAADVRPLAIPGTSLVLAVPADWTTVVPADGTVIRLAKPGRDAGLAIAVASLRDGEGPAGFTQRSLSDLQRLAYEFDLLDWDFTHQVGTRNWSRLHFRFVSGNQRWEEWLYLTTDNGQGVAIAFSTLPTVWDAWKPVFERAIQESSGSRPLLTPR